MDASVLPTSVAPAERNLATAFAANGSTGRRTLAGVRRAAGTDGHRLRGFAANRDRRAMRPDPNAVRIGLTRAVGSRNRGLRCRRALRRAGPAAELLRLARRILRD